MNMSIQSCGMARLGPVHECHRYTLLLLCYEHAYDCKEAVTGVTVIRPQWLQYSERQACALPQTMRANHNRSACTSTR